ncbi:efflux transporter outer membrane subunit [Alteromonas gilva]|uniref:TolC family protein n=1 Tax=Alteromonas gilva TaxID=2987522 RepID=A0ABT5L204_9ALTE|nr:TolC family protein [Alteromonas gilva]MDC8831079.1 TolC family protein [Alteromonas gilva]
MNSLIKHPVKLLGNIALLGMLSACAVGPDYVPPAQVETINVSSGYQRASALQSWWRAFNDEQLNALIVRALEQNRTLHEASANVERARAVFSEADASLWPDGTVSGNYQAGRNTSLLPQDNGLTLRGYTSGLGLSWDADIFRKLQRAEEAAKARAEEADLLWQDTQLQIISQVVSSYGQYRGAQLRMFYAQMNLHFLQQSQAVVEAQVAAGSATKLALAQIETQVYRLKTSIPAIQIAQQTAKSTLAALLALPLDELQLNGAAALPQLQQPLPVTHSVNYLKYRPDVASAERNLAASSAQIGVMTADLYPSLSVSGFLGFISSPNLAFNSASESWNIAPALQWSGLNLGVTKARIRSAEADSKIALARYEQTVIDAINEMQLSLNSYQLSREQMGNATRQYQSSQEAVDYARANYQAGTIDFLQLLDSERELLNSRDQLTQIELAHFIRLVDVYRSFGGALEWQTLAAETPGD